MKTGNSKLDTILVDILCSILGHKITDHVTQPGDMVIDWCDRCGKYRSFLNDKKALRAFNPNE